MVAVYVAVYVYVDLRDTEANMLLDKLQVLNSIVDDHEVITRISVRYSRPSSIIAKDGSVAEWLACWTQAQKHLGSNRSLNAVE